MSFLPSGPRPSDKVCLVLIVGRPRCPPAEGRGEGRARALTLFLPTLPVPRPTGLLSNISFEVSSPAWQQQREIWDEKGTLRAGPGPPLTSALRGHLLPGTHLVPVLRAAAGEVLLGLKRGASVRLSKAAFHWPWPPPAHSGVTL